MAAGLIKTHEVDDIVFVLSNVSDIMLIDAQLLKELKVNIFYTSACWDPVKTFRFFLLALECECRIVYCNKDHRMHLINNGIEIPKPASIAAWVAKDLYFDSSGSTRRDILCVKTGILSSINKGHLIH
jgi:hypothetical protein